MSRPTAPLGAMCVPLARSSWPRLALLAALGAGSVAAALAVPDAPALAQGYWDGAPTKPRKAKRTRGISDAKTKAKADKATTSAAIVEKPIEGPLVINVSLSRQRLRVYDATGLISEAPVSSGRVGYSTPTGVFTVIEKSRMHHSNLYSGAPMPHMQRITWSGVALHAGVLPGYPASHGCIRLPPSYAKKLFGMTKVGTRVIVSREPVAPMAIETDRLFAAYPPEGEFTTGSTAGSHTQVADASGQTVGASSTGVAGGLVTSAAAATPEASAPSQRRSSYRERRAAEAAQLAAEIRTAGYDKAAKGAVLQKAARVADATRPAYLAARGEADRERINLAKLERTKASAERELADLQAPADAPDETKKKRKKPKVVDETKKAKRIAELTAELGDLGLEIEPVRARAQATEEVLKAAEAVAKEADAKRRVAVAAYTEASAALSQALAKEADIKRREAKRSLPVSIFVSRAKQRIYVRQGWEDIFDAPVTIAQPEAPIGTHVFTALAFTPEKTGMEWSVVSVPYDPTRVSAKKRKGKDKDSGRTSDPAPPQVDLASQTAQAALDRLAMSDDVREQIEDVMKPGSSLVISDLALSDETGEYTDFIARLR